jgi:hypothetical protein
MEKAVERGLDWAGLPVIATVARLLCHAAAKARSQPRGCQEPRPVAFWMPQIGFGTLWVSPPVDHHTRPHSLWAPG